MIKFVQYLSEGIHAASIAVIFYGIIQVLIRFVRNEIRRKPDGLRKLRADFGGYLLLGLELLIGADILKSIIEPTYQELIVLGGIVVLRTVLSVFLNREIREIEDNVDR